MHKFRCAAGLLALTVTTASLAEPPTGSRLGDRQIHPGVAMTQKDVAIAAREMARCLFDTRKDVALALLQTSDPRYADHVFKQLSGEASCYVVPSNDMVDARIVMFQKDVLRGMFAESALLRSRDAVSQLQPLPVQQKRYLRPWFAATGRNSSVDEMGACIADSNPSGIMALIGTVPKTSQESAAFAALGDSLGKCLSAGTTLHASPEALRAALADALYQRVQDPALSRPSPPATEAHK